MVIFGPLKRYWTQERDQFESSKRQKVTKANFILIYSRAHRKALTPENIKAAFRKTGACPFNPDVVTKDMMAPSLEMSSKGSLPLPLASPVKVLTNAIRQYQMEHTHMPPLPPPPPPLSLTPPDWLTNAQAAEQAVNELVSTSARFLVSSSPVQSTHSLPAFIPTPITPTCKQKHELLEREPESAKEKLYQEALHNAYECETYYKSSLAGMQSTVVLQSMFCDRLSSQLAAQEEKKNSRKSGQLIDNGLPRLLTGDEFHSHVVEHQRAAEEEEAGHEAC